MHRSCLTNKSEPNSPNSCLCLKPEVETANIRMRRPTNQEPEQLMAVANRTTSSESCTKQTKRECFDSFVYFGLMPILESTLQKLKSSYWQQCAKQELVETAGLPIWPHTVLKTFSLCWRNTLQYSNLQIFQKLDRN